jgi:hypothetical protein
MKRLFRLASAPWSRLLRFTLAKGLQIACEHLIIKMFSSASLRTLIPKSPKPPQMRLKDSASSKDGDRSDRRRWPKPNTPNSFEDSIGIREAVKTNSPRVIQNGVFDPDPPKNPWDDHVSLHGHDLIGWEQVVTSKIGNNPKPGSGCLQTGKGPTGIVAAEFCRAPYCPNRQRRGRCFKRRSVDRWFNRFHGVGHISRLGNVQASGSGCSCSFGSLRGSMQPFVAPI